MKSGLYEHLLTLLMKNELDRLGPAFGFELSEVDPEDAHSAIAQFLERLIVQSLARYRGEELAQKQATLVERLLESLAEELSPVDSARFQLISPLKRLIAVHEQSRSSNQRPDTPLARSALLTGTRLDPALGLQLCKEIATCDRMDILCSFVKWSGLRIILDALKELAEKGPDDSPRISLITTSYMGATDPRAIEELSRLPNTEIKVSYDTKRTRLHAKAYLFYRESGFGSAYVGSANLSNAALSEGLEWTTKLSQYELPYMWSKVTGTFETYWQDDEFQPYSFQKPERLRQAISFENKSSPGQTGFVAFDLRPFPFQEEILDAMRAERELSQKRQHLIVAATGTGKTMIAAFDYARVCQAGGQRPSLLFVAHREEILRQALASFRGVLRDQNFGDLFVGDSRPQQGRHLFCSIQSYNSRELWSKAPSEFQYVVVDEFHHAAAPSYRKMLDHIKPDILVGLTATPERTDQLDILSWFGGRSTAEIRLPDAIGRRLLCPFQYFGVSDSVDLDGLTWQRGGYRVEELNNLYTGNDVRAELIYRKLFELLLDPNKARAIGFCVSVAHAKFMARYFNEKGLKSVALSGDTPDEVRFSVQNQLRSGEVQFIFVVDLYNEGVDIPEVDTILFLRPTESLTIYLQQFGRGLRLSAGKEMLTVLDFIGAQRREFRFAQRFRALSTNPAARIDQEIENGFPHLPSGCSVNLERIARQRILDNVRDSVRLVRSRMVADIKTLGYYLGRKPTINETLEHLDTNLDELLKRGLWSNMLADAQLHQLQENPDHEQLAKGLRRISHIDCPSRINFYLNWLKSSEMPLNSAQNRLVEMLMVGLWGKRSLRWTVNQARDQFIRNPDAINDLTEILEYKLQTPTKISAGRTFSCSGPLNLNAQYTRDEILVGLGHWSLNHRPDHREGVLHHAKNKLDALFVTLRKTESEFSPTTMYEDYFISHDQFHWQSQSNTSADSNTGQRYIHHRQLGYQPLLFVREAKNTPGGLSAPYYFLGPCQYQSHQGSRPMSIVWKMLHPVPAGIFRILAYQNVV